MVGGCYCSSRGFVGFRRKESFVCVEYLVWGMVLCFVRRWVGICGGMVEGKFSFSSVKCCRK